MRIPVPKSHITVNQDTFKQTKMATERDFDFVRMNWNNPDKAEAMALFKQQLEMIFRKKKIADKQLQVDEILLRAGETGIKKFNSWGLSDDHKKDPAKVWEKFNDYGKSNQNFRVARLALRNINQIKIKNPLTEELEPESIDEYMSRLRLQAAQCDFDTVVPDDRVNSELDERLIEQLIAGTLYSDVQKDLLAEDKALTLDKAVQMAKNQEASDLHMKQLKTTQGDRGQQPGASVAAVKKSHKSQKSRSCQKCGGSHSPKPKDKCPAYGSKCYICGMLHHWSNVCKRKQGNSTGKGDAPHHHATQRPQRPHQSSHYQQGGTRRKVHAVDHDEEYPEDFEELDFHAVDRSDKRSEVVAKVKIKVPGREQHPASLSVKVDTGAEGNIIPLRIFNQMCPKPAPGLLEESSVILTAYNGTNIPQVGVLSLNCSYEGEWSRERFFVADTSGPAILGLPSCRNLKMLTLHCAIAEAQPKINTTKDLVDVYPEQFDRIGHFPGKYHIVLDPTVPPVIHAPRKCPIHLKDEVKKEIEKMLEDKIIRKVDEPTDWVSSLAYSRRGNGLLRICLDPKDLNKAIKRCHHRTPTLEEITHKLFGARYYSKLDAKNGFWSVELDEESQLLTCFNSPFGRFCFQRMPFGLVMSQDVFQQRMDQILEKCRGAIGIADDVVVYGKDEKEHDDNLHHLMKVAKDHGLIFNSKKCSIKTKSINFFGAVYDQDGVHPDPKKVEDIKSLQSPMNETELQHILGIMTYMSPFIPRLSEHTASMRDLLKKGNEFNWTSSHEKSFQRMKELITKEATLAYFDPTKKTTIQVDASSRGLGAAVLQEGKPIAFASKALTPAEQRYANIEREMLAVVFGCKRFHTYIYGKHFTIESDHKPLEMITLKNLSSAPPRLQRMLLEIQGYDVTISYRPGKEITLADGLSRLPNAEKSKPINLDLRIQFVQFGTTMLQQLKEESRKDTDLSALKEIIVEGWPAKQKELPAPLRVYWSFRDQLSVEDCLILNGPRIFIPKSMRGIILERIHTPHMGIEKSKLRARSCVYWYKMDEDIEDITRNCQICQEYQATQQKEPLNPHDIPRRPWQVVSSDLFFLDGINYVVIADNYSKFPFVRKIHSNCTSNTIVQIMKELFAEHGIPGKIITDNGPQYASSTFQDFAREWGFDHVTSSPHFPQSNGFAERNVQTIKNIFKKCKSSKTDPFLALLCLRSTPIDSHLPSPAELLYTRKIQSNLPGKIDNPLALKDRIYQRLSDRQETQKKYYDEGAKSLPPMVPNQQVLVQNPDTKLWKKASIEEKCNEPRSYKVATEDGQELRRNRHHLREVPSAQTAQHKPTMAATPQSTPMGKRTSSGREVKMPTKYKDFV